MPNLGEWRKQLSWKGAKRAPESPVRIEDAQGAPIGAAHGIAWTIGYSASQGGAVIVLVLTQVTGVITDPEWRVSLSFTVIAHSPTEPTIRFTHCRLRFRPRTDALIIHAATFAPQ